MGDLGHAPAEDLVNNEFTRDLTDFSDGANSDASSFSIKDSELVVLDAAGSILSKNVRPDPLGPIAGRLGTDLLNAATGYNVSAAGDINFPIKMIHRYHRQDGTHRLVMTANTRCFSVLTSDYLTPTNIPPSGGAGTDPAFANASSQTDVNVQWESLTFKDWVYFTSGLAFPRRTDGAFVYRVGEDVTAVTTAPALIAGTIPAGTYYYRLCRVYVGGLGESPVSAEFSFALGAPGGIQHTMPALERADQASWALYRSAVGQQGGPYFLVATGIPPGAFNDTFLESQLGSRVDMTRVEPAPSAFCAIHHERLWLARITDSLTIPTRSYFDVQFSDANRPDQFPAEFRLRFPNPSGEPLRGIASYGGVLYLFTLNYLFAVVGTGVERGSSVLIPDYRVVPLGRGPGAMSQRTIQNLNGVLFFTNKKDIWRMEGGKVESVSEFRIRKLLERTLDTALADRAQGTITRTQYRVSYPKLNGNGLAAFTIVYDTQADAFIPDEGYAVAAYCYLDGEADANELLASEADNFSLLYELESGNADWDPTGAAETAIQRIFRTKDLSLGAGPSLWKQHRFLELEAATTDATITIYAHLDRDATTIQVRVVSLEEEGG
ncbi:MAG TPA: hypothetical protein VIE88_10875, partial [Vicinamibacteria bacterium]